MTTATIMATWDAAETMLVTVDVVKTDGIHVPVLEPIGIVFCLMIAGWFFARRLWELKLLTLADFIGSVFGKGAEKLQAFLSFSYIGWVAVQLIGLAGLFAVYFDISTATGVVILTVILALYALVGCIAVHVMTHWLVTWHEERGA